MENLSIQANRINKTPSIDFNTSGDLSIKGRSLPDNAKEFYKPVIRWIQDLEKYLPPKITLTVNLEYYNTSTSQILLNIIKMLEKILEKGKSQVIVIWQYQDEDEDMLEAGNCFQSITKIPFQFSSFSGEEQNIYLS